MADDLGRTRHIRELNDQFRREMPHGSVRIRGEAKQFSNAQLAAITQLVRSFDAFRADSDLEDLHAFGAFVFQGFEIVWQIEFSAPELLCSTDEVIARRIVIRLADEGYADMNTGCHL
jgi:NAD/NADP transhydrogenase alpha subunit